MIAEKQVVGIGRNTERLAAEANLSFSCYRERPHTYRLAGGWALAAESRGRVAAQSTCSSMATQSIVRSVQATLCRALFTSVSALLALHTSSLLAGQCPRQTQSGSQDKSSSCPSREQTCNSLILLSWELECTPSLSALFVQGQ